MSSPTISKIIKIVIKCIQWSNVFGGVKKRKRLTIMLLLLGPLFSGLRIKEGWGSEVFGSKI